MATIPRSLIDNLTDAINALSEEAQARVMSVVERLDWSDIAEARKMVVQALRIELEASTQYAAQLSAEFYDLTRAESIGEAMGATALSGYNPDATEGAIRAGVQSIVDGKRLEVFYGFVRSRVDYEIKRAAGNSMFENGMRDPLKPRFARVPTGVETCAFCIMLASRGFVYHSFKTAGGLEHYHPSCDCRIVCGWDTYPNGTSRRLSASTEVEGYDVDALYDKYVQDLRDGRLKLGTVSETTSHVLHWRSSQFGSYGDFASFVRAADDIEDLQERCAVVIQEWPKTGLSDKYMTRLSSVVNEKRREFDK